MSEPFLGEIRIVSFNFPPKGWAFCNGQLLPINQNQALFSILGTTYGGNGTTNFALPNLQARVPLHFGTGISLGQQGGSAAVTLSISQIPSHFHALAASTDRAAGTLPTSDALAKKASIGAEIYAAPQAETALQAASIGSVGGSQPHQNLQPFLVLNFVIAVAGIFPTRD